MHTDMYFIVLFYFFFFYLFIFVGNDFLTVTWGYSDIKKILFFKKYILCLKNKNSNFELKFNPDMLI